MKSCDIMEAFVSAVEDKIFGEWKHEGFIGGWSTNIANFEIDGKEYSLLLREVPDGGHWSDILSE